MIVAAVLSHRGRQGGNCDDDDGVEEVVEDDDNGEAVAALGGGGSQKVGFKELSRRTAKPMAPLQRCGAG